MPSIFSNLTVATGGRILNTGLGLAITALLARLLGSANYGTYSVLLSYGVMFQIVADFGLYLLLAQRIGQDSSAKSAVIPPILTVRLVFLSTAFAVGAIAAMFVPSTQANLPALLLILLGLACQSISQLCMGIYQANRSVTAATVGDTVGRMAQIAGLVWMMQALSYPILGLPVVAAALVFGIGTVVALGIHLFYLPDRQHLALTLSMPALRRVVKESWPLGAMLILNTIYFRIDMLMLPVWRGAAEIGWYALAYRLVENSLFFPAMMGGLLLPHLSAAFYQKQGAHAQQLISEALRVAATAAAVIAVIFIATPKEILVFIGGQEFIGAAPLLRILTLALVVMFFGNIFGFTLVAQKQHTFLMKLYIVLVGVNIVVNIIAIPALGAMGAALATLLTEIIACGTAAYKISSSLPLALPVKFRWSLLGYVAACAALSFLLPKEISGVYRVASVGVIALSLAYLARLLRRGDIPLLLQAHPTPITVKPYA